MYTNKWAYQEDVLDAMVGFPVSLEGVDTNGTIFGHIWVEDFGQEKTCVCVCVCVSGHHLPPWQVYCLSFSYLVVEWQESPSPEPASF